MVAPSKEEEEEEQMMMMKNVVQLFINMFQVI
jgi:hypothetical protein